MARKMTRAEAQAMGMLIDEFGADFAISMSNPVKRSKAGTIRERLLVEDVLYDCKACDLCSDESRPLFPYWSSAKQAKYDVAVVTPSPFKIEHEKGEMGYGPWHNDIRQQLAHEGVHNDDITWVGAVAGYPGVHTKPDAKQIATCKGHLINTLDAANAEYALLVGPPAAYSFRPDLRYVNLIGHWFIWQNRYMVFVVPPPPSKGPRGKMSQKARVEREEWDHWITLFARGVQSSEKTTLLSSGCIHTDCNEPMFAWDDDGVPWCDKHMQPTRVTRDKRKPRGKKKPPDVAQERML